ncbi:MAG TPA: substrate-binding domain-containing protein [Candidatus Baltobacteraceae bacterium]|nr:substrate-binding domain-containing protein [Candidatus Baltobacteraceae bacterium]
MPLLPILALVASVNAPPTAAALAGTVSVAYAGSLVRVMEGPLAEDLARDTGLQFAGEGKGSKALAQLIAGGVRRPDDFISADASLLEQLRRGPSPKLRGYILFGSARMVVAYSPKSPYAALFAQAIKEHRSLLPLLSNPSIKVGRTDPALDPKGARTLKTLELLGKAEKAPVLASSLAARSQVFPEEDLAVRVETGELDAGFFYSTEIPGRNLQTIELPASANLSHDIVYGVAALSDAPHPQAAHAFLEYLLGPHGRAVLQSAGVRYFSKPRFFGTP